MKLFRFSLLLILVIKLSPVQGQFYTGILMSEFTDSLKQLFSPSIIKNNHVKIMNVYRVCNNRDSTLLFKSYFDDNGSKIKDEVYEKKKMFETRWYEKNNLVKIDYENGSVEMYFYHKNKNGSMEYIDITNKSNDSSVLVKKMNFLYNEKNSIQQVVLHELTLGFKDTVTYKTSYNQQQLLRSKNVSSRSLKSEKISVFEDLIYKYDNQGKLLEIELIQRIGSNRLSLVKSISYNKNGLISEINENNNCILIYNYIR